MSHVVHIVGLSGNEFWLDRDGREAPNEKNAKVFRSVKLAEDAKTAYLGQFASIVQRGLEVTIKEKT